MLLTYSKNLINGMNLGIGISNILIYDLIWKLKILDFIIFVGGGVYGLIWSLFEKRVCKCSLFGGEHFPTESNQINSANDGMGE